MKSALSQQDPLSPFANGTAGESDQQLLRIRRIGKRLFGVADCIIVLGRPAPGFAESEPATASAETAFCHSLAQPRSLVVVPDTHQDKVLVAHERVAGAPHIRFYAAYPIHSADKVMSGSINVVDYVPRVFSAEDRRLLADLARLVEREIHLRTVSAIQRELEEKNRNLRKKSLTDPLVGTWNRRAIMRILSMESMRCHEMNVPISVIVADVDFFKKINDTYGHPAGDAVLVRVANRLGASMRAQEALGRYGGEEFLVVLPGTSHHIAMAVAERMRLAIASHPEVVGEATLNLTISAGVASTEAFPLASVEELINRADMALYAAKDAGRNRVAGAMAS